MPTDFVDEVRRLMVSAFQLTIKRKTRTLEKAAYGATPLLQEATEAMDRGISAYEEQ